MKTLQCRLCSNMKTVAGSPSVNEIFSILILLRVWYISLISHAKCEEHYEFLHKFIVILTKCDSVFIRQIAITKYC